MFFLLANLQTIIQQNEKHPLLGEVLAFHKRWNQGNLEATKKLKDSTPKGYECKAKQLLEKEIKIIQNITERNQPRFFDAVGDFFGRCTSQKRFSINCKLKRLAEFMEYALTHFDRLNELTLDPSKMGTGIYPGDAMVTHDALALKIVLLFQKIAAHDDIHKLGGTPILYRFDTQGFDLSGSVFSGDKCFLLPHNGYTFSGQREQGTRYRWGPEDCTTLIIKYFPEIPELGFSTLIVWKWLGHTLETEKDFKDYRFMGPLLDSLFEKVDDFKPGDFLLVKGHIWFVLGKEKNDLHVMNYTRSDFPEAMNGFLIKTLDFEQYQKDYPNYVILRPKNTNAVIQG